MKTPNQDPRRIVRRLLVYGALLSVLAIVLLHFLLFGSKDEALKLLLPSALASLIIVLLVYAFRYTLLEEADKFLTQSAVDYIATQIVNEVRSKTSPAKSLAFFERWYEVPWQDVIGEAKEIELLASYMDTWIIQTADLLQQTFARGGSIRVILPSPKVRPPAVS